MQKALQYDTLRMLATALLFCFFFETTKHVSALVRVNPFAEDPYDAIGSFAVQFALFVGLLSMIRALRTGSLGPDTRAQRLIARGNLLCIAAVILTLLGDCVALARHTAMWRHSAAGRDLLLLTGAFWVWTVVVLWLWYRTSRLLQLPAEAAHWTARRALPLGALAMVVLTLALYPEGLRETILGALLTVVAGMTLLFVPLRAFASMIPADPRESDADAIDDIVRFGRTLAPRHSSFKAGEDSPGIWQAPRLATRGMNWLRRNRWAFILVIGIAIGAFLGERELADSQAPYRLRQLLTVGAAFIGLESAAILMGAALLSRPLRLLGVPSPGAETVLRAR
jgi:uncharacterized protein (DUF3820 family)